MQREIAVFWFRRDLRLEDNAGLYHALNSGYDVLPIFIFDTEILAGLPKDDARVTFLYSRLQDLRKSLEGDYKRSLAVFHGTPEEIFKKLMASWKIRAVYTNRDYEPYALERDRRIQKQLKASGVPLYTFKDQVIFERSEVVKADGSPYVVYTPYKKRWKTLFRESTVHESFTSESLLGNLLEHADLPNVTLHAMDYQRSEIRVPDFNLDPSLVSDYENTRNYPGMDRTSRLGPHLRFGTISIRKVLGAALQTENETFWDELIWREFFMQILWHFPNTVSESFKKSYDRIRWRNDPEEFKKWKKGETGFPLVDAGMRQLNQTGYMHNRVRMLTASFLCKHLLIDWRWGESYFAEKLLDYELSSNVGNWQWAAGSGVDAAPYFRIFNPITQVEKFDRDLSYITRWVPEYGTDSYPEEMVDHKSARERCLKVYKEALG